MPDKLDKIVKLTNSLQLPNEGLYKLKDDIDLANYNVLLQNKISGKTYSGPSSLFENEGDQSQNAIPLSGTVIGSPVTGDIEFYNAGEDVAKYIKYNIAAGQFIFGDDNEFVSGNSLYLNDGTFQYSLSTSNQGIVISSNNTSAKGLYALEDFTPNITDLDYTQKIYVGFRGTATLEDGTVTVATDKIKTGYKIYLSVNTPSGTQGFLSAPTGSIVDETSFVINSSSALDNSTVNWWIAP